MLIRRPHIASLVAASLLLLVASETLRMAGVVPDTLTGHDVSMTKYESLGAHVADEGPSDIVVLGPSFVRRGVVPDAVAEAVNERLRDRRGIRIYNFGVPGHNVLTYPTQVGLVLGVDSPQLVVMHVSPRAINPDVQHLETWSKTVMGSPYGTAIGDSFRLRGDCRRWLLDHLFLAAYAPTLRTLLLGGARSAPRERGVLDLARGFAPARVREGLKVRRRAFEKETVATWRTQDRYADALDRAVALAREKSAEVLLVDAPVSLKLIALMEKPAVNLGGLNRFFNQAKRRLGVKVARVPPNLVSQEDFADLTHLLPRGATKYSHWLGKEIARRYPDLALE